jgi:transposase-like protein
MKKHRSLKLEQKARGVLQVLTGQKSAAQICRELQISESLLSRWKKQFLVGDRVELQTAAALLPGG